MDFFLAIKMYGFLFFIQKQVSIQKLNTEDLNWDPYNSETQIQIELYNALRESLDNVRVSVPCFRR